MAYAMTANYLNIPEELRLIHSWCLWRYEDTGGKKPTKVPYQPNGELMSVTNPQTWHSFFDCIAVADSYSGIGFIFSDNDPYTFIDLDDPTGDPLALERQLNIFRQFDSYSEASPSGKGLHII